MDTNNGQGKTNNKTTRAADEQQVDTVNKRAGASNAGRHRSLMREEQGERVVENCNTVDENVNSEQGMDCGSVMPR